MNRALYDAQFRQFSEQCREAGIEPPSPHDQIPVLDGDSLTHSAKDYDWTYLNHCAWAARKVREIDDTIDIDRHIDFGSYVYFAAIVSAFVPVDFYDLRGFSCPQQDLKILNGDLTCIPFPNNSQYSVSSLHTLEHVGLGRYGDTVDAIGDKRAAKELVRIIAPGGKLIIVLPANENPRTFFNAHRFYSAAQIQEMFAPLKLEQHACLFNDSIVEQMQAPTGIDYTFMGVFTK